MEAKRRKKRTKALSHKDRLLEQSNTFQAFGRLFQTSAEQAKAKAEKDVVLAKVCTGLSQVCKVLAEERGGNHGSKTNTL